MSVYIGLIHKEPDSVFGVSFPDLPGHIAAGHTIEEAMMRGQVLLALLDAHWLEDEGQPMPRPRSFDELSSDAELQDLQQDAIVVAIPVTLPVRSAAE